MNNLSEEASSEEQRQLLVSPYTAAVYDDLEKLQRLVECEGCSVSEPNGLGYSALQWAALNNQTVVAQYSIEYQKNEGGHKGICYLEDYKELLNRLHCAPKLSGSFDLHTN